MCAPALVTDANVGSSNPSDKLSAVELRMVHNFGQGDSWKKASVAA